MSPLISCSDGLLRWKAGALSSVRSGFQTVANFCRVFPVI